MSEIEAAKVEEVDDEDDFSPPEMRAYKEHHKGKLQEVVEDEVTSNTSCSIDPCLVRREEHPDISGGH